MQDIIVGLLASLLTQFAKNHPSIPLSDKNILVIRLVVALLSVAATVLAALAGGSLSSLDWHALVSVVVNAGSAFLVASGVHSVFLRKG